MIRVLMLGWELPPHNSGGLGVVCQQLCKALSQRAVDIEFVLPYQAQHDADFMKITAAHPQAAQQVIQAGTVYDSASYRFTDSGGGPAVDMYSQQQRFAASVSKLIKHKQYDIIHAHDWLTFRAALQARLVLGCPLVLHVHSVEGDRAGGQRGNPLVHEIEANALRLADRVVAVSQRTKAAIVRDYKVPADMIEVIHNSIDKATLPEPDQTNDYRYLTMLRAHGYKVVVNVGRLTIQKGLPHLLHAAKEVLARAPKTIFLIVGDGEEYRPLLSLAAELGIGPNIIFAGFQRGKRWRDAFAVGDLFVMPSISEPFGLTPLEAIHYGTPSLISKQSGIAEVLRNCLKVDFWDVREMANQITTALTHDALRTSLRDNLRQEYDRISWDHSVDKLLGVYKAQVARVRV